jgi:uroporphyrinogen-III synthase
VTDRAGGTAASLSGLRVVVTRPAGQADGLMEMLRRAGAEPIHFPTIEVQPLDARTAPALGRLADYQIIIFISRNAVQEAVARIAADGAWPEGAKVAAVGRATAAALSRAGRAPDLIPPSDYSTEGLLELPELHRVAGRRILIVRGAGGRELLAETLRARGAEVDYAEVYRRTRPAIDAEPLRRRLARGEVDVIVVTSREGQEKLFAMMGRSLEATLRSVPLAVISDAVARASRDLGVMGEVMVASEATDRGLLRAIEVWHRRGADSERR